MSQPIVKSSNGSASMPVSPAPTVPPTTEVTPQAQRRSFTTAYKLQILHEADHCPPGQLGALLRREGLYSSHLTTWRRPRDQGELGAKKRGPMADPQAQEIARLKRQNARLQAKLEQAEIIIDVQKKLCDLLGLPTADTPQGDSE